MFHRRCHNMIWTLALVFTTASLSFAANQLAISPSNPKQLNNSSLQFTAKFGKKDATKLVTWSSSNPGVASVAPGGLATLLSPGTTTITAAHGGQKAFTVLTVTVAVSPVFSAQPTDTNVSAVIDGSGGGVKAQLLDNLGDPLPGQSITVAIGTNPPGTGTLSGTLTQMTDSAGTATFPDLKIDWLGSGYTLVASASPASGPVSGTSAAFNELRVGDACLGPDTPACSSGCADTDLDGLNDAWEHVGGVDINGDGLITDSVHDVLLPGANPNKPDIYLKYDYMVAATHSHQPPTKAFDQMTAMFTAHGIALHVLAPAAGIPEHRVTTLDPNAEASCAGDDFITMQQLRGQYLNNLKPAYHYMVFAHDSTTPNDGSLFHNCPADALCAAQPLPGATGVADVFGDDSIISGGYNFDHSLPPPSIELWSSLMMHELGHNFGLGHGSLADSGNIQHAYCTNYAPNYISVMNYDYEMGTIVPASEPGAVTYNYCTTDADCGPPSISNGRCSTPNSCFCTDDLQDLGGNVCYRPDYAEDQLLNLNETTLNEYVGVGGSSSLEEIVWYYWNGGTLPGPSNGSPIDWNNDGFTTDLTGCTWGINPTCPDINNNLIHSDQIDTAPDWAQVNGEFVHLNFQFQCAAGYQNDKPGTMAPVHQHLQLSTELVSGEPSEISIKWAQEHHRLHLLRPISISVTPGCSTDAKPIAAGQFGTVRVALLGSDHLDVSGVDTTSLKFHGASPLSVSVHDANADGRPDLIAIFDTSAVKLHPRASVGRLTGWLKNGQAFWGEDKIRVVPSLVAEDASCR